MPMDCRWNLTCIAGMLICIAFGSSGQAVGQVNGTGNWNIASGSSNWQNLSVDNWGLGVGAYPSGPDAIANLSNNITGTTSVRMQTLSIVLRTLNIGDSIGPFGSYQSFAVTSTYPTALWLGSSNGLGMINASGGTNTVNAYIRLSNSAIFYSSSTLITSDVNLNTHALTYDGPGSFVLNGVISEGDGVVAVTKNGAGSLLMNSIQAYSGNTVVNGGTIFVNGTLPASTAVYIQPGATLGGTGTIHGDVDVVNGAIAPGLTAFTGGSTLTVNGDFSMDSASQLNFQFAGLNTVVGNGVNDLVTGVDNLTLDGTLNISEVGAGSFLSATAGDKWRIFNYTGTLSDQGLVLGITPALGDDLTYRIDTSVFGQVNLSIAAVPEPTSGGLLIGLICAGLVVAYRRNRSEQSVSIRRKPGRTSRSYTDSI